MKYKFDHYVFDVKNRYVAFRGHKVELTPKLHALLLLFVEAQGHVVSRQEIHDQLWSGRFVSEDTLYKLVARLRSCLSMERKPGNVIDNVHGVGYRFTPEIKILNKATEMAFGLSRFRRLLFSMFFCLL